MSEMHITVEIQSERLVRMVATYLWEYMWWILTFTIRWLLQWGSKVIFNINKIQNPNPERWKSNSFVDLVLGSFGVSISRAHNFGMRCSFGVHGSLLEMYHWVDLFWGLNQSLWVSLRCSILKNLHLCS